MVIDHRDSDRTPVKLRFAVMLDADTIPTWQAECIRALVNSGVAELVAVVRRVGANDGREPRKIFRNGLYYLLRAFVMRTKSWKVVDAGELIRGALSIDGVPVPDGGQWCRLDDEALARLRGLELDFILRFGFNLLRGEILNVPRHGIWSFHHGDPAKYRGRPAILWELLNGEHVAGVVLQRLTERLDGGTVLKKGIFKLARWSIARSLETVYAQSVEFPVSVCRQIVATGRLPAAEGTQQSLGPVYGLPGNSQVVRLLLGLLFRGLGVLWNGLFIEKHWTLGWRVASMGRMPEGNSNWNWLPAIGSGGFLADPFLIPGQERSAVLCEFMDYEKGRGTIAFVYLDEATAGVHPRVVIDGGKYHLSYPCLVKTGGRLLCIPELAQSGKTWMYELSVDGSGGKGRVCLLEDFSAVDPTVFRHEGRWWLLCTREGGGSLSSLYAFHAEEIEGPWISHPANPIVVDVAGARPAGIPFIVDGQLFRPGQDCSRRYGGAIVIFRVLKLSALEYQEQLVARMDPPTTGIGKDGMHSLSRQGNLEVVDGYNEVFSPFAWKTRLKLKLVAMKARKYAAR